MSEKHGMHQEQMGVFNFLPEGMDTFSTVLVFIIIFSALIQFIYMISPRRLKNVMEHYDYDPAFAKKATLFNF